MRFHNAATVLLLCALQGAHAFTPATQPRSFAGLSTKSALSVIGLGPEADEKDPVAESEEVAKTDVEAAPFVEPDHESFRDSRLSDFDKKCDDWYASILSAKEPHFLGSVSEEALRRINTLCKLEKVPVYEKGSEKWSPYKQTLLPSSPILPSYGLEQYGLPIPRRNAEAWRQYDVAGLVGTDYSGTPAGIGSDLTDLDEATINAYTAKLKKNGAWLDDDECAGRLVYINGRFVPSLSVTSDIAKNLSGGDFSDVSEEVIDNMNRLTDGFTDRLAADVPSGESEFLTSMEKLSEPNHNVGKPTSQFSINNQQGTACFVALNSVRAGCVAFINVPEGEVSKPVMVINAISADGGLEKGGDEDQGVSIHPRTLLMAGENSTISLVQNIIDLDEDEGPVKEGANAKFINGCTQVYVKEGAKVKHSYLEESGGLVTQGVEKTTQELKDESGGDEEKESPRDIEAKRSALKDTLFETIDVHLIGDDAKYETAVLGIGGNGRSRIAVATSLLRPGTHAGINGFCLSGGAQRTDLRTLIHHIAQGTTSYQAQKNMIGGRATTTFKGRIRVEQSAQQTDSNQLARTILMSDKARVWAIPSLEIIADDVECTHGATVSDLSEEELFYLRSRGVDRTTARNILMFGFVDEVSSSIEDAVQGQKDDPDALRNRIIKRLQNMVAQGEKTLVGGEFQSV